MLATEKSCKEQGSRPEKNEVLAEDNVRKAFESELNAPVIEVLQVGFISPSVTYELTHLKTPHTNDDFYAVNISNHRPGSELDNWLMSGVFWTRHEAESYIHYLRLRKTRFSESIC